MEPRPRATSAARIKRHIDLIAPEWCGTSNVDSIVQTVLQAPDLTLSGVPEPTRECDGISLAITFAGTPVAAAPTVAPACDDPLRADGGAADAGAD